MSLRDQIRRAVSDDAAIEVCAPGRVNLIGEHTDYSLLPVLPIAIDRALTVRMAEGKGLRADSERLEAPIVLDSTTELDALAGWHRYLWAAARVSDSAALETDVLIGGDLPHQGGLSSSSALTLALIAGFARLAGEPLDMRALVDRAVAAERLTGVAGGAMDQNIIARAQQGHALRIGFDPVSFADVAVPEDVVVIAAHSGSTAAKGAAAKGLYNARVVGCRVAAFLLGAALGAARGAGGDLATLSEVSRIDGVQEAVEDLPESSAVEDIVSGDVQGQILDGSEILPSAAVPVRKCARHVLAEAARVDDAVMALSSNDIEHLGELFNASHASLQDFGASTDGLDAVVAAMRNAGAAGARLTGAGFGGYAVAICRPENAERVIAAGADIGGGPAFIVVPSNGLT